MNRKISLRTGVLTGMVILIYILGLVKYASESQRGLLGLVQFAFLFIGVFISCYLLFRYYADIKMADALSHCFRTVAATLVVVLLGNTLFYFIFSAKGQPFSQYTLLLMKNIFAYSLSGVLSSFFSSLIFHTFTKK